LDSVREGEMALAMAVVAAAILGFLAGLLGLRLKSRWCPACGATLSCSCREEGPSWTVSK
jgi:hypothetical protein